MGVANQCATKIGSLFVFSKEMFFFFRLDTKEKEPKRKNQGCVFSATPVFSSASKRADCLSVASFCPLAEGSTGVAEKTRPGDHAAWARVWAAWGMLIVRLSLAGILRWFAREHLSEVLSYPCLEGRG